MKERGKREQKYPFLLYLSNSFDHWRETESERESGKREKEREREREILSCTKLHIIVRCVLCLMQ